MYFYSHQKRSHLNNTIASTFRDPTLLSVKQNRTTFLFLPIRPLIKTISTSYMPSKKLSMLSTKSLRILDSFRDWLLMTRPNTLLNPTLQPILITSNLATCSSLVLFFADFLRSFDIFFDDFLRSFVIFFADFLRSFVIFIADFFRSFVIFLADFMSQFHLLRRLPSAFFNYFCSSVNMNSLTFKLQTVSN